MDTDSPSSWPVGFPMDPGSSPTAASLRDDHAHRPNLRWGADEHSGLEPRRRSFW
jgi:hypothetical protein